MNHTDHLISDADLLALYQPGDEQSPNPNPTHIQALRRIANYAAAMTRDIKRPKPILVIHPAYSGNVEQNSVKQLHEDYIVIVAEPKCVDVYGADAPVDQLWPVDSPAHAPIGG